MTLRVQARRGMVVFGALALAAGLMTPAAAYPRPGATERASAASDGTDGSGASARAAISADGRYVAFESFASNLVFGDTNSFRDVFVWDRETGVTERISVNSDGEQANSGSSFPALSTDGRYVAFASFADNLASGVTNGFQDIFVHDRATGDTERVSVASDGTEGNGASYDPAISADGRFVAFHSAASNLVPGDTNEFLDVFVHDRATGTTERVSIGTGGEQGSDGGSVSPSVSADGRYVAFYSSASNLVVGDTNGTTDVFVHDRATGVTELVSVSSEGAQGNLYSIRPSISANGRYVAFYSVASNLVPGDANETTPRSPIADVFVRDREIGTTELVSVAADGVQGNGHSVFPSISADGRYVAFESLASNFVPHDTNGTWDVFVHDRAAGAIDRVSVGSDGAEGNGASARAAVSADGRYVTFASSASNLVPGDTNAIQDVFVRDRGPGVGVGEISAAPDGSQISVSGWATFSGRVVTEAADPPDDGAPGAEQVGAELTGASLTYRPEQEDLLVRLRVASLPGLAAGRCVTDCIVFTLSTGAGAPGILYGLEFDLEGTRYELRALRAAATASPAAAPHFALYRCDPDCAEQARLAGGIGTTGHEVLVSAPLSLLEASEGATLREIRAYTAVGEADPGAVEPLDEVHLPDATIPATQVSLGVAPASAPEEDVVYTSAADPVEGRFSGSLDVSSLATGAHRVWARACVGDVCGARSVEVAL